MKREENISSYYIGLAKVHSAHTKDFILRVLNKESKYPPTPDNLKNLQELTDNIAFMLKRLYDEADDMTKAYIKNAVKDMARHILSPDDFVDEVLKAELHD